MIHRSGVPDTVAGRYRIARELGGGGMSTVYLAKDEQLDRPVAIKIMRHDLDDLADAPARFRREIEVTARFSHPNILSLLDSGTDEEGHDFYVMPFIDGESLRERIAREHRLSVPDALQITRDVASALVYAHGLQVVHRDVKPENILLSQGRALVADFGIARALFPSIDHTTTVAGLTLGTPTYMSPEQMLGEAVDERTDLYALGCVLYEMLAGELPFQARSAVALLARKISASIPDVQKLDGRVGAPIVSLVIRAMAREPDARFPTARTFLDAIDLVVGGGVPSVGPTAPRNSVAVLPFRCPGDNTDDEYLGDGISEELMQALTRLGGLRVMPRTSAFAFRRSELEASEIGRRLNVRRIVDGSIRRAGAQLRVSARLVDADSGEDLWSARYDRRLDELFTVEDEIAAALGTTLKAELLAEHGQRLRTEIPSAASSATNLDAYEFYLKGRHFWGQRTNEGLRRSADLLEQAVSADPSYALAHAALADTLVTMGLYGCVSPASVMAQARAAADRALVLNPDLAEALTARACVRAIHEWDWEAAQQDFKRALRANAQYPTAHQWYGMHCLVPQGRFDEARLALARAQELDPLSLSIAVSQAAVEYYDRQPEASIAASDAVIAADPAFAMAHYFRGLALEQAGRLEDAVAALATATELAPSDEFVAACACVHATAGSTHTARELLDLLVARGARRYISPVLTAQVHVALGDATSALRALHDAVTDRAADLMWLRVRPAFDALRSHPEFTALLQSLHLTDPESPRPSHLSPPPRGAAS